MDCDALRVRRAAELKVAGGFYKRVPRAYDVVNNDELFVLVRQNFLGHCVVRLGAYFLRRHSLFRKYDIIYPAFLRQALHGLGKSLVGRHEHKVVAEFFYVRDDLRININRENILPFRISPDLLYAHVRSNDKNIPHVRIEFVEKHREFINFSLRGGKRAAIGQVGQDEPGGIFIRKRLKKAQKIEQLVVKTSLPIEKKMNDVRSFPRELANEARTFCVRIFPLVYPAKLRAEF